MATAQAVPSCTTVDYSEISISTFSMAMMEYLTYLVTHKDEPLVHTLGGGEPKLQCTSSCNIAWMHCTLAGQHEGSNFKKHHIVSKKPWEDSGDPFGRTNQCLIMLHQLPLRGLPPAPFNHAPHSVYLFFASCFYSAT